MKRCLSILLTLVLMLSVVSPSMAASQDRQETLDGRAYVENSRLVVPGGPTIWYHTRQQFTGNYTVEMRASVHYQAVGLMLNSTGYNNPALWCLALVNPFGVWIHPANNWGGVNRVGSSHVKQDTFVNLKLEVGGDTVKTYLNGDLVRTDNFSAATTNGQIGLRFDNNESGEIDYVRVTQNGSIIFEDEFDSIDSTKWTFPPSLETATIPVWEGDTAYEESFWPVAKQDGSIDDIQLLYKIDEIVKIQNQQHSVVYEAGRDYAIVDGKIRILPDSRIPVMSYEQYYPTSGQFPTRNGRYIFFPGEGVDILNRQILVTYKHSEVWPGQKPAVKSNLLPKTTARLQNRQSLKIVYNGDSITEKYNASGALGSYPFVPRYSNMVTKLLQQAYPNSAITDVNTAVAGKTTAWGLENVNSLINNHNPDLVLIAFGMNDANALSADTYISNIKAMMASAKEKNPNCEFVLVTTSLPNMELTSMSDAQKNLREHVLALEEEGVAVADMTTVHETLLQSKQYKDMTGNNVNHPNDYLHRVYAQLVFQTINGYDAKDDVNFNNISYVDGSTDKYQTMDIRVPTTGEGPYPVVVFVHGGAWVKGDKNSTELQTAQEAAVEAGYVAAIIGYRLAQNAPWPAQIYDCKAAVRFLRANAEKYHIDPERVGIWGASAGAHLAQMMGVTNGMDEFEDLTMGSADYSSDVDAVVSYYGISDVSKWDDSQLEYIVGNAPRNVLLGNGYTTEQALAASPITYVENAVPMILEHGTGDTLVPVQQSYDMEAALKEVLDPELVDTFYPQGQNHATSYWRGTEPTKAGMNFLQKRFYPEKHLDSIENTRPSYGSIDHNLYTGYANEYLNLKYAEQSAAQKLHLFVPKDRSEEPMPLIVFVHGGGFGGGNSGSNGTSYIFTAEGPMRALQRGYAVALVDYRHAGEAYYPNNVYDVKAAIRYLRANADTYGLDTNRFALWGESAGGHLVNYTGQTNNNSEFEDLTMGNAQYSSAVQAVVSLYAITDMTTSRNAQYRNNLLGPNAGNSDMIRKASPIYQATENSPPTYFQHGMADNEVEYQDSVNMYNKLMGLTGDSRHRLELFPGLTHAVRKFISEENASKLIDWLDTVMPVVETEPADKSDLIGLLAAAEALLQEDYTPESWAPFDAALTQAKAILEDQTVTQEQVNTAHEVLEAAMEALVEASIVIPVDKLTLELLLEKANALNENDYTAETWADFAAALVAAEEVFYNEDADQDIVNNACAALDAAIKALKKIGGGEDIEVTKIKINASGLFTLSIKKKAHIPVTIEPNDATDQTVTWISTNPNIFTVDGDGNITPKKQGTATLTAVSSNGLKSTIIVRITA